MRDVVGRAPRGRAGTPATRGSRRDLGAARSQRRVPRRGSAARGGALARRAPTRRSWGSLAACRSSSQSAPPSCVVAAGSAAARSPASSACCVAAIVLAGVFLRARNDANHRANVALSRERAASALAELSVDPHQQPAPRPRGRGCGRGGRRRDAGRPPGGRGGLAGRSPGVARPGGPRRAIGPKSCRPSFDRSGRRVVTAGWDGTARVWDASTGASQAVVHTGDRHLETAAFSPDGKRIVTAGDSGAARVWNSATGAPAARASTRARHGRARCRLQSRRPLRRHGRLGRDGPRLGRRHREARRRCSAASAGRRSGARSSVQDGSTVATAGDDGLAVVWRIATRKPLARLRHGAAVTSVRFGPNGSIVTASDDGTARVWHPFASRAAVVLPGAPTRGHRRRAQPRRQARRHGRASTARRESGTPGPARRSRFRSHTAAPSALRPSAPTAPASSRRAPTRPPGSGTPARGRSSPCSGATAATSGARRSARTGSGSSRRASTARHASGTQRPDEPLVTLGTGA